MNTILKTLAIFWLGIVPLLILVLIFGPMFAPPAAPYVMDTCDSACMDDLLR